jgi:hypothetical protein
MANDIEKQRLEEIRYIANAHRRLHTLADKFSQALIVFEESQQRDSIARETTEELSASLDRIERLLLIILNKRGRPDKSTKELEYELIAEHIKSLRTRIFQERLNLDRLLERAAEYGRETPLHIVNQVEKTRTALDELQAELDYFLQE